MTVNTSQSYFLYPLEALAWHQSAEAPPEDWVPFGGMHGASVSTPRADFRQWSP